MSIRSFDKISIQRAWFYSPKCICPIEQWNTSTVTVRSVLFVLILLNASPLVYLCSVFRRTIFYIYIREYIFFSPITSDRPKIEMLSSRLFCVAVSLTENTWYISLIRFHKYFIHLTLRKETKNTRRRRRRRRQTKSQQQ